MLTRLRLLALSRDVEHDGEERDVAVRQAHTCLTHLHRSAVACIAVQAGDQRTVVEGGTSAGVKRRELRRMGSGVR